MKSLRIVIPKGVEFYMLNIVVNPDNEEEGMSWNWAPLEAICKKSKLDFDAVDSRMAVEIIATWYLSHKRRGGAIDEQMEKLLLMAAAKESEGEVKH